jgi:hypothetical protein
MRCNTQTSAQVRHFPRWNDARVDGDSNGQSGVSLWVMQQIKIIDRGRCRSLLAKGSDVDCSADPSTGHKQDTTSSDLSYVIDFIGAP